ncbi:MAG: HEAT repeat domain-containing protein [Anaerolineae bacterium]|nr:HEAT repeat domain-containing protein [Anaerolineae bacterium]
MKETKALLRRHLAEYDLDAVAALAERQRRALSYLVALTYEPDPKLAWRAIEGFGLAAAHIADRDPEFVRVHLRRLLWLLSDESGGIGWRAPELIGEVLHNRPGRFPEFMPILASLMDMEPEDAVRFRAGWLWAVGRVATVAPAPMQAALPWVEPCLADPDPQVRGMAVWCLSRLGRWDLLAERAALLEDDGPVVLYEAGELNTVSVGMLARRP